MSTHYTVEIQKPDSYSSPVSTSKTLEKAERLAKRFIAKQPAGTYVYVTTCGTTLTTYHAS